MLPLENAKVAPPRGERGLKRVNAVVHIKRGFVAPPRGERGLKLPRGDNQPAIIKSLPLVGSVD